MFGHFILYQIPFYNIQQALFMTCTVLYAHDDTSVQKFPKRVHTLLHYQQTLLEQLP